MALWLPTSMGGIFLILVAAIWLVLSVALSVHLTLKMQGRRTRIGMSLALTALLFLLPFADELIGSRRFKQICENQSTIVVAPNVRGKTAFPVTPTQKVIEAFPIKIVETSWRYLDIATYEELVTYQTFGAGGGWLRGLVQGSPLFFDGSCSPLGEGRAKFLMKIGITLTDRPGPGQ